MATLNFPQDPIIGELYEFASYTYKWDGEKWKTIGTGSNPTNDFKSTTLGDVSVTLTATDTMYQYFNTALTAQRSITLPSTGVYDGMMFTIIRWGLGEFILQVIDPLSGKSVNLPASTKSSITYRANGSGEWVPTQYSTFP